MKQLKKLFIPFEKATIELVICVGIFWVLIALGLWSQAPALIPGPQAVGSQLFDLLSDSQFYADIFSSMWLTIEAMMLSIVISCLIAYLSVIIFIKPIAHFLVKLRFMSLIGFIFTFTLLLHGGGEVKLSLLMFGITPFFTLSMLSFIEEIQQKEYDLWTTLRYSRWEQVKEIIIIGKANLTIKAVAANFAMGWLMITMVESFSMADGGIGVMLFRANKYNQLDKIFALQIIVFSLGMGFDYLLKQLRYLIFPHTKIAEKK